MSKQIVVLGSTGSIGTQCLEICRIQQFQVMALAAHSNLSLLEQQVRQFRPKFAVTADPALYSSLKTALADLPVEVLAGPEAVLQVAALPGVDWVVNAISGIAGLRPTLAVLASGNQLALANKEALVVGGELVMQAAKAAGTTILPVDSEHSAIWQCLRSGHRKELTKIILTASGGPFFGYSREQLEGVSLAQTLAHPTWSMGKKITVDSATLMNKGLEVIEALWLFDLTLDQVEVVIHRQSVVHSAVEYCDGSVIAQMGTPDMRVAIQYALTYPKRFPLDTKPFSLTDYGKLTFDKPDLETFSCLASCMKAAELGGFAPAIVNGANEEAVALFLQGKIRFLQIGTLVASALERVRLTDRITLDTLEAADRAARDHVCSLV